MTPEGAGMTTKRNPQDTTLVNNRKTRRELIEVWKAIRALNRQVAQLTKANATRAAR
jgi:hypothetical protein